MKNNLPKTYLYPKLVIGVILFLLALTACQPAALPEVEKDTLLITVSILPQAYFVERIGGDLVNVNIMVGPGEEAHTYEPLPEQMRALNDSLMFFSVGIEYEDTWIPKFKDINPNLLIVDSTTGIQYIQSEIDHTHEEVSSEAEETHLQGTDPHVWLAPANGKIIAENIYQALLSLSAENAETFTENYEALIQDIDSLNDTITQTLAAVDHRTFMVFHPAWGYFADQYNLEQIAVQVGGQDPSPAELADLVEIAKDEQIGVIFIQPTFSTNAINALSQEINAEIVVVDPLAEDWLANLQSVAAAFAVALQ
jgi:zinc transport system substrate-binding protein